MLWALGQLISFTLGTCGCCLGMVCIIDRADMKTVLAWLSLGAMFGTIFVLGFIDP